MFQTTSRTMLNHVEPCWTMIRSWWDLTIHGCLLHPVGNGSIPHIDDESPPHHGLLMGRLERRLLWRNRLDKIRLAFNDDKSSKHTSDIHPIHIQRSTVSFSFTDHKQQGNAHCHGDTPIPRLRPRVTTARRVWLLQQDNSPCKIVVGHSHVEPQRRREIFICGSWALDRIIIPFLTISWMEPAQVRQGQQGIYFYADRICVFVVVENGIKTPTREFL